MAGAARRLGHELRLLAVALQFLTRVPVPAALGFEPAWLNQCVRWFPLVGAAVGLWGALVLALAAAVWPPTVAALLCVAATLWLTGAFHEDGLADTFDALGGAVPREKALAIMKDSRIGTYGAAALVLALALRAALLAALLARGLLPAAAALLASQLLGRTGAVLLMALLPYAGDAEHAKAKPLATSVAGRGAAAAVLVAAVCSVACCGGLWLAGLPAQGLRWCAAALAAVAVVGLMRRWLRRRLGGYTGDTLGATEQLTEIAVLAVFSATGWA
ncbi:MAG TPA: adenosylcobinamide-GDP ribazoletransferase [Ideonella sp.]|nr:adenosylcobinamide-GDP ribazoletransferase [Ideonella sp.]